MENKEFNSSEFRPLTSLIQEYSAGEKQLKGLGAALKLLEDFNEGQKKSSYAYLQCEFLDTMGFPGCLDLKYAEIVMIYRSRFNELGLRMDELRSKLLKAIKAVEN